MVAKKVSPGSAIIVLLGLTMMVMLCAGVMMRLVVLTADVASMRAKSTQHMYAAEGMLLYGIAWCRLHRALMEKQLAVSDSFVLYKGPWKWVDGVDWEGSITLFNDPMIGLCLETELYEGKKVIAKQAVTLSTADDGMIRPTRWSLL
jgi:hypothetical protein